MFRFVNRKAMNVSIIITNNGVFLVFNFRKHRTKYLKNYRKFYAKVFSGEISIERLFTSLEEWLDSMTDGYLLERLEDSPNNSRPVIKISAKTTIDFNVVEDEVVSELLPPPFS